MATVTLINDFHGTSANVRPILIKDGRFSGYHKISRKTAMRLRNELCGINGCVCGGKFGERGGVYLNVVNEDYDRNYIIDMRCSSI